MTDYNENYDSYEDDSTLELTESYADDDEYEIERDSRLQLGSVEAVIDYERLVRGGMLESQALSIIKGQHKNTSIDYDSLPETVRQDLKYYDTEHHKLILGIKKTYGTSIDEAVAILNKQSEDKKTSSRSIDVPKGIKMTAEDRNILRVLQDAQPWANWTAKKLLGKM
jgi:hypothetical protein